MAIGSVAPAVPVITPSAAPASGAPAAPAAPVVAPKPTQGAAGAPSKGTAPAGAVPEAGKPADKAPTAPENPPDPARPFKLVVEGKTFWLNQDQLVQWAQKGAGANQRFQEAHKIRQQAESVLALLKRDPRAVLSHPSMGIDFDKLAEEHLMKRIEREKLTPEQKELADAKEKLKTHEENERKRLEEAHAAKVQELTAHYAQDFEKDIIASLETSGLPKTRGTVKRMAHYMYEGLKRGYNLKAGDVAGLVLEDYQAEIKELHSTADGDTLLKLFGEDVAKKIREADLRRVQGNGGAPAPTVNRDSSPADASPRTGRKIIGNQEFRDRIKQKVGL